MKSQSRLTIRAGFTLLELTIAMGIGAVVLTMVANAYLGANKAQGRSVASGLIKASGQAAVNDLYQLVRQSHTIFGRGGTARSFLERLPIQGYSEDAGALSPGAEPTEILLPIVTSKASFWEQDASSAPNPDFDANAVGNALLFATSEPKAVISSEFGYPSPFHLTPHRLHFYFLARRALPSNARPIVPGAMFTYQLMHFESQPYLNYQEVVRWLEVMKDAGVTDGNIDIKLGRLRAPTGPFHGAIDLAAGDADPAANPPALYQLVAASGHRDLEPNTTEAFKEARFHTALKHSMRDSFGESMVAFNTNLPSPVPELAVPGVDTPAFAEPSAVIPYGFEVLAGGEKGHRQVLIRLALAARTQPGSVMIGQTFQQVVHCYADAVEGGPPIVEPTPTPTPVPSSGVGS